MPVSGVGDRINFAVGVFEGVMVKVMVGDTVGVEDAVGIAVVAKGGGVVVCAAGLQATPNIIISKEISAHLFNKFLRYALAYNVGRDNSSFVRETTVPLHNLGCSSQDCQYQ